MTAENFEDLEPYSLEGIGEVIEELEKCLNELEKRDIPIPDSYGEGEARFFQSLGRVQGVGERLIRYWNFIKERDSE